MSDACTTCGKDNAEYAVSYIASAPEELKVGDRVEFCGMGGCHDNFNGRKGIVIGKVDNGFYRVGFGTANVTISEEYLRKLPDASNPMDKQVGGNHYKKCKIEPAEYIHANGLDFFQGNVVKYITRFRDKDGKADLEKIKHYCDMLIQMEYPEDK